jgi:hypothetical protein
MELERDELDEMAICMDVDNDVIDQLRDGRLTQIVVEINEENQNLVLKNIDGRECELKDRSGIKA